MGGRMSQNKGKRGEREIINLLQPIVDRIYGLYPSLGTPPILQRNTLQSDRGGFDIVGLDWFAPEVKFQESLNVNTWWRQTAAQAQGKQEPVLFFRQSRKAWRVMMKMYANTDTKGERFFSRAEISMENFMLYFEYRLHAEVKAKAEGLEYIPGAKYVR